MSEQNYNFRPEEPIGILATNLLKVYDDPASDKGVIALRGVEIDVKPGQLACVIGPSGAGKSTLLNLLGGMTEPTAGEIYIGDIPVHSLRGKDLNLYRSQMVGFLWQFPERNLLPELSVEENIEFTMRVGKYPKNQRSERIKELISSVGLSGRQYHKLGELSGGEAQRAGLAVALANEPRILFADEPTGELDSETTMEIIGYLQDLNEDLGVTMLVVTHDNRFERMSNQSYRILDGQISGVRRSLSGKTARDWKDAKREELAFVDQYGNVRIPADIRTNMGIGKYIRFIVEEERLYLEPAEDSELE